MLSQSLHRQLNPKERIAWSTVPIVSTGGGGKGIFAVENMEAREELAKDYVSNANFYSVYCCQML